MGNRTDPTGLIRLCLRSRELDRREALLMRQGRGRLALSAAGHEGLAALAGLLGPDDLVFSYYRDRALLLARGLSAEQCASNFFASARSGTGGRSESVLVSDPSLGIFSAAGATGIQCLPAVGAAWSMRLGSRDALVLCTIGDAATRQGEFYEALAFAIQLRLPVVFVVEDNGYGISTATERLTPVRLELLDPRWIRHIDARDPLALEDAAGPAFATARAGRGPVVLWCELDRLESHIGSDDHRVYRSPAELEAMQARDPLKILRQRLEDAGDLDPEAYGALEQDLRAEVAAVYAAAEHEPAPDPAHVCKELFAPIQPVPDLTADPGREDPTLIEAFNATLGAALAADARVLVFGQDVEDPKGGVFGYTRGLSTGFPGRVVNAPLAEATIIGAGVGLAATGMRPVCELQFIDFATPGFHQIANSAANLRWRSNGAWSCPLVIYAPYGAYVNSGFWHAASNEAWFAHIPGLRVAIPTTPTDAAGLLWTALHADDPTLILLPKSAARARVMTAGYAPVPFGSAALRRRGDDCTLVSWGSCVALCEAAADAASAEGIGVDVLDLRTLVPCDWDAILTSVGRTGRLIVVQEDARTCGFGATVIAEVSTRTQGFYAFLHEPQLISRPDVPIGFAAALEQAVLPNVPSILTAIRSARD